MHAASSTQRKTKSRWASGNGAAPRSAAASRSGTRLLREPIDAPLGDGDARGGGDGLHPFAHHRVARLLREAVLVAFVELLPDDGELEEGVDEIEEDVRDVAPSRIG